GVAALHLTEARARDGATAVQTGSAPAETNRGADPAVVLIALGDQPLITPAVVASILTGHRGGLTVPTYAGRRGHPFCVDRSLLDDLLTLPPEAGLRELFLRHPGRVTLVPVATDAILRDIDTPSAYRRALAERAGEAQACRP
ncbi:nucleotidyltransferase family protein, partial [Symbiobacterium thermophilum]|uniref:nucleotidyltransferase family protein n=1 Tax=Symbiobacterium thermophilum TaxID=2734 RepID=UPI0035C762D6